VIEPEKQPEPEKPKEVEKPKVAQVDYQVIDIVPDDKVDKPLVENSDVDNAAFQIQQATVHRIMVKI
jgi:hypothetical protein